MLTEHTHTHTHTQIYIYIYIYIYIENGYTYLRQDITLCIVNKQTEVAFKFNKLSTQFTCRSAEGGNRDITKEVGLPICEAFVAYNDGDYARAVDIMCPVRYKIIKIGGSHAQVGNRRS